MPRQYVVAPQFSGDVIVGTDGDNTKVYLRQVAGGGKSDMLRVILEYLATREQTDSVFKPSHPSDGTPGAH
jgi:hypothetical protein